jgi:hypothetical protein
MRTFLTIILTLFWGLTIFATPQIPDKIIYKGKEFNLLYLNLLESYFIKHPNKRPQRDGDDFVHSTGLHRGYIATFKIENNQLFLKDIGVHRYDSSNEYDLKEKYKSVFNEVFPNRKNIKIDWFTGILVLPNGEYIGHLHGGYGSVASYEKYILLELHNGNLKKEIHLEFNEYEKYKEKQLQLFKQTEEYEKLKLKYKKDENYMDSFIKHLPAETGYISIIVTE